MSNLSTYSDNLLKEIAQFNQTNNYSEVEKLLFLYVYYNYLNADASRFDELIKGCVYNSNSVIGGVYVDDNSDEGDIDIIIPIVCKSLSCTDIEALYNRAIDEVVLAINSNNFISTVLFEYGYEFGKKDSKRLKFLVVTDFRAGKKEKTLIKKQVDSFISKIDKIKNVTCSVIFGDEIEYEILEIEDPREYVEKATFCLDSNNNYLMYGDENSLVVNLSAKSIQQVYDSYGYRGLFAQNLRYHVKNAKVDDKIKQSMTEDYENFWYYNNGIIIICDDYRLDMENSSVTLNKFSIINGGQTTKIIGETIFENDFYVQCKIVRNKYQDSNDKLEFISKVAEASNTQKPIKEQDLIANRVEQRNLKKQLSEIKIYCQIKRGEKLNKQIYKDAWQNTNNVELGQFILSFLYQKPGSARNNKSTICGNKDRYDLIFKKQYNSVLLKNLMFIKMYYKDWIKHIQKKSDQLQDGNIVNLTKNGMFFMTSIIGLLCKLYYRERLREELKKLSGLDRKIEYISQYDISHPIFKEEISKQEMFDLFMFCYKEFFLRSYEVARGFKPDLLCSNYTKTNSNYENYLFPIVDMNFTMGEERINFIFNRLSNVLYNASELEKNNDNDIFDKYSSVIPIDVDLPPTPYKEEALNALKEYRKAKYQANKPKLKLKDIFDDKALDRIATYAPHDVGELEKLRCLSDEQIKSYGDDILNIIHISCRHSVPQGN